MKNVFRKRKGVLYSAFERKHARMQTDKKLVNALSNFAYGRHRMVIKIRLYE